MRISFLICLAACLVMSCDSSRVYESNHDFRSRTWLVKDTARFEFDITDPGKPYNLLYNVRNSLDYPFARLFVEYSLEDSAGSVLQRKLVSAFLFDQKSGKPQGNSGLGDVYDHQFPLLAQYEFPFPGKYRMKLVQFMRQDTLQGMLAVGIRLETAGEKK